jgi:hypothetical protein
VRNRINPARCVQSTWRPFYLCVIPLLATKFTIVSYKLVKIYVNSNKCIKCRFQKAILSGHAPRGTLRTPPPREQNFPLIDKARKNTQIFRALPLPYYVRVPIFIQFYVPLRLSFLSCTYLKFSLLVLV